MSGSNAPLALSLHGDANTSSGSDTPFVPSPTPHAPSRDQVHSAKILSAQAKQRDIEATHAAEQHMKAVNLSLTSKSTATPHAATTKAPPATPFNNLLPLPPDIINIGDAAPMLDDRLKLALQQLDNPNLSPHQRRLYEQYRDDVEDLLLKQQTESVRVSDYLYARETEIKRHESYRLSVSLEVSELLSKLLAAKKLEVYARYGDYLADRWMLIRKKMNELRQKAEKEVSEYCSVAISTVYRSST